MLKFKNMTTLTLKQKVQVVTIAEKHLLLLQFAKDYNEGFQNITGGVEYDENFVEAARRELLEEIGFASNVLDIGLTFHFPNRWGESVEEKVFLCLSPHKPTIHLSAEHQSYKWVPLEKVLQSDFHFPSNFEAFQKALEFMK
jgi:8-oxo-dGTP pyrophosphatase MutT (NUDIX family)